MRTIEEIKKELQGITCITETPGQFPFLDHELRVQKLIDELIAAQDAEIARLRDAIMEIRNAANECSRSSVDEALGYIEDVCIEMLKPKEGQR